MADNTDLFLQDASIIIEEAPSYDAGLAWLEEVYREGDWDDKEKAQKALTEAAEIIRNNFKEPAYYDEGTTKYRLTAPIEDYQAPTREKQINLWEEEQLKSIQEDDDPYSIAIRPKLENSIKRVAQSERRKLNGKPGLEEQEDIQGSLSDETLTSEFGRRFTGGLLGGPAYLAGYKTEAEALEANPTGSFGSDVAGGVGFIAGVGASTAAGGLVGGPAGAAFGAASYILANAASAVYRTFEEVEEENEGNPYAAAGIEAGSQAAQIALGGGAATGLVKRSFSGTLKPLANELTTGTVIGGATATVGAAGSQLAGYVGGRGEAEDYTAENILKNTAKAGGLGLVLGPLAVGTGIAAGRLTDGRQNRVVAKEDVTEGGGFEFNGTKLFDSKPDLSGTQTASGRTRPSKADFDEIYRVDQGTHDKIKALSEVLDPEGEPVHIYVDEAGNLVADNPYLTPDLTLEKERQNGAPVKVNTENGTHTIKVMRPRVNETGGTTFTKPKSAGAADIQDLGYKERRRGEKMRLDPETEEHLRDIVGDIEGPGLSRYFATEHLKLENAIEKSISDNGIQNSVEDYFQPIQDARSKQEVENKIALGNILLRTLKLSRKKALAENTPEGEAIADKFRLLEQDIEHSQQLYSTAYGSGLAAFQIAPAQEIIRTTEAKAKQLAAKEIAKQEKITIEELRNTIVERQKAEEALKQLVDKKDVEVQELETLLSNLKKANKEKTEKAVAPWKKKVEELKSQIKKLDQDIETVKRQAEVEIETLKLEIEAARKAYAEKAAKTKGEKTSAKAKESFDKKMQKLEGKLADAETKKVKAESLDSAKAKDYLEKQILDLEEKISKKEKTVDGEEAYVADQLEKKRTKAEGAKQKKVDELKAQVKKLRDRERAVEERAEQKALEALSEKDRERLELLQEGLEALPEGHSDTFPILGEIAEIQHKAAMTPKDRLATYSNLLNTYYIAKIVSRAGAQAINVLWSQAKTQLGAVNRTFTGAAGQLIFPGEGFHWTDGLKALADREVAHKKLAPVAREMLFKGNNAQQERLLHNADVRHPYEPAVRELKNLRKKLEKLDPADPRYAEIEARIAAKEELAKGELAIDKSAPKPLPDAVEQLRKIPVIGKFVQVYGLAFRGLEAGDILYGQGTSYYAEIAALLRKQGRKDGLKGKALDTFVAEKLYGTKQEAADALAQARKQADVLKNLGIERTETQIQQSAREIIKNKIAEEVRAEALYNAGLNFLARDVPQRGVTATALRFLAGMFRPNLKVGESEVANPLHLAQPLVSTVLKGVNQALDWTPIGFFKAASGKYVFNEPHLTVRDQVGAAFLGSSLIGGLIVLANTTDQDGRPLIEITGPVPKDAKHREVFFGENKKPWHIRVKGTGWINFSLTPLAAPLGIAAMYMHKQRYDDQFNPTSASEIAGLVFLSAFKQLTDLGLMQNLANFNKAVNDGSDTSGFLSTVTGNTLRNLIPFNEFAEEIVRMYQEPTTTKNDFMATLIKNTPFTSFNAEAPGLPIVNLFGEPVSKDWLDRLPVFGSAVGRFVQLEGRDPDILWMVNNGYANAYPGIGPTVRESREKSSRLKEAKQYREENLTEKFGAKVRDTLYPAERLLYQIVVGPRMREVVADFRNTYGDGRYDQAVFDKLAKKLRETKNDTLEEIFLETSYMKPEEVDKLMRQKVRELRARTTSPE